VGSGDDWGEEQQSGQVRVPTQGEAGLAAGRSPATWSCSSPWVVEWEGRSRRREGDEDRWRWGAVEKTMW
jgi:hypothetical protein